MLPHARMNQFTKGPFLHTQELFGLMANGPGAAAGTFTLAATGTVHGQGVYGFAENGKVPRADIGGTEATGAKPPNPLKGEF